MVTRIGIAGLDIGLLTPTASAAAEQVHGAGIACIVIACVAINSCGCGALSIGTHRQGVAISRQGYAAAELVTRIGIAGLDIGLLAPAPAAAAEQIHRAGTARTVIACVAINSRGCGALSNGTYRQGIAIRRQGNTPAEIVIPPGIAGFKVTNGVKDGYCGGNRGGVSTISQSITGLHDVAGIHPVLYVYANGFIDAGGGDVCPYLGVAG